MANNFPVSIPESVLKWRETLRTGTVMKPRTFKKIKRTASRKGYVSPSAAGGKAYWITLLSKYLKTHSKDMAAKRAYNELVSRRYTANPSKISLQYNSLSSNAKTMLLQIFSSGEIAINKQEDLNAARELWLVGLIAYRQIDINKYKVFLSHVGMKFKRQLKRTKIIKNPKHRHHELIIRSLHGAQAECPCGWYFSYPGKLTREEIVKEYKKHLRKNPVLETAIGVGAGITAGEIGKYALHKSGLLKNSKLRESIQRELILVWGAKQLGKTVDQLTGKDIENIYYAVEKKKKPFRMTTGEEALKRMGLKNPMTIGSVYDDKGNYYTIQLMDDRFFLYKNYRYTGKFFKTREEANRFLNGLSKTKNPVKSDYYIGLQKHGLYGDVFSSGTKPTRESCPQFHKIIGPFKSMNTVASYVRKHKIVLGNPGTIWHKGQMRRFSKSADTSLYYAGVYQAHKESAIRSKELGINPGKPVEIYNNILAIEAAKGSDSLWPEEKFRHDFSSKKGKAKVLGMPDGSIMIKGKKKLWKKFDYPEKNPVHLKNDHYVYLSDKEARDLVSINNTSLPRPGYEKSVVYHGHGHWLRKCTNYEIKLSKRSWCLRPKIDIH